MSLTRPRADRPRADRPRADRTGADRSLADPGRLRELAEIFALLGDPSRLRLLTALLEAGELCVGDLAAEAGMGESAVSHALRLLRAHRVVAVRRAGRMAYYSLCDGHVRGLLTAALEHLGHDDG